MRISDWSSDVCSSDLAAGAPAQSRASAIATALALSLLNPHVYLDTVVLIGSIAGQFPPDQRVWFAVGAMIASCLWFYGLGFGAGRLAPLFARPAAWRVLDVLIGCVMRSEEHTSELQSLMRISYAVFCLNKKTH